ncbi:MAG: hypothetical protein M3416_16260 [Acidobacteriota bacterium]|nr:hypothetical protein [Acidobacteriota bacterium]
MEEKHIWMFLFVGLLLLCIGLTIFLIRNAGGVDSRKKYEDLKSEFTTLADKHSKLLQRALTLRESLAADSTGSKVGEAAAQSAKQCAQDLTEQRESLVQWRALADELISGYDDEAAVRRESVRLELRAAELKKKP